MSSCTDSPWNALSCLNQPCSRKPQYFASKCPQSLSFDLPDAPHYYNSPTPFSFCTDSKDRRKLCSWDTRSKALDTWYFCICSHCRKVVALDSHFFWGTRPEIQSQI
jgi:hypothetical protein